MKKISRLLALLMVLSILLASIPMAGAIDVEAGATCPISFSYSNVYGLDGKVTFSNRDMLSSVSYDTSKTNMGGSIANDKVYLYGASEVSGSIGVTVKVSPNAKPGDSCTITLTYETSDENGVLSPWKTSSVTITVKEKGTKPTEPTKPTDTKPTSPTTPTSPTKPTDDTEPTGKNVDYTELKRQIGIAEGLKESDYTKESWANLVPALETARGLTTSESQSEVDAGAKALADAIAALVKFDNSKLKAAIEAAKKLQSEQPLGTLWESLLRELDNAASLLDSGDQVACDQCADRILALLVEITKEIDKLTKTEQIIETVKVPTEPTGPYCNIDIHKLWPILFFISLGLNIVLIGVILVMVSKRKKNEKDDTPLVDYDIDDDLN